MVSWVGLALLIRTLRFRKDHKGQGAEDTFRKRTSINTGDEIFGIMG